MAKMKASHFLFLGYSMRDWNMRVILKRLWKGDQLDRRSWAGQLTDGYLRRAGIRPRERFEIDSYPAIATMVDRGLGVNIHFTDPRPGEIKTIADAGFRWVRMDFVWEATEKTRGRYDFSAYDRLLESLRPFDIGALLILDYGNQLYDNGAPPRTENTRRAFADWAAAAARHFAGRRVIWEVYNEPNNKMFWRPQPDVNEYVALALAVGRAFRAAAPNEKLIGPAGNIDPTARSK